MLALICSIAVSAATVGNCRPVPDRNLLDRMRSGVDTIGIVHFSVNTFTDPRGAKEAARRKPLVHMEEQPSESM